MDSLLQDMASDNDKLTRDRRWMNDELDRLTQENEFLKKELISTKDDNTRLM